MAEELLEGHSWETFSPLKRSPRTPKDFMSAAEARRAAACVGRAMVAPHTNSLSKK